jgi:hypothetical protein
MDGEYADAVSRRNEEMITRAYRKPHLTRLGLLRLLTRFSF